MGCILKFKPSLAGNYGQPGVFREVGVGTAQEGGTPVGGHDPGVLAGGAETGCHGLELVFV